jgi:hypothetical protein
VLVLADVGQVLEEGLVLVHDRVRRAVGRHEIRQAEVADEVAVGVQADVGGRQAQAPELGLDHLLRAVAGHGGDARGVQPRAGPQDLGVVVQHVRNAGEVLAEQRQVGPGDRDVELEAVAVEARHALRQAAGAQHVLAPGLAVEDQGFHAGETVADSR